MTEVEFSINGKHFAVSYIEADLTLNSFLRNHVNLRGTKVMCHEGGCGVCIVSVKAYHPVTKEAEVFSVNSCLVSILSCHGWEITTVEGIGNKNGIHPIQSRLAAFNGTQCGFCTPGWVMSMYSLQEQHPDMTMKEVENSFAGNICRCTGYRPISDAFKSFATDYDPNKLENIRDIEDLSPLSLCKKTDSICSKACDDYSPSGFCIIDAEIPLVSSLDSTMRELTSNNTKWFKVYKIQEILDIFEKEGTDSYMLVVGNTAQGVYHVKKFPRVMIDTTGVSELREHKVEANLILGANMTLSEVMQVFLKVAEENEYYHYTLKMVDHIDLVAHIPVRNIGSLAGNLSIKHQHREFPSDIFLLFESVGVTMTIVDRHNGQMIKTLPEYLKMDMTGKVIHSFNLPPLSEEYIFQSHKVMHRAQNSHAIVNAAFLFKINSSRIVERASIVFGGINPDFIHATETERFVTGKNVFKNDILKLAIQSLSDEIFPNIELPEPSPEYRKKLALGLFYKTIIHLCPQSLVNKKYVSGGIIYDRPVSSGQQEYETDKSKWPLNEPVKKLEALAQCSGEAKYINDMPTLPNEAYAAFVVTTVHDGFIDKIDVTDIMANKETLALFTAADIPGKNSFSPINQYLQYDEEILCSGKILYYGQPLAIVVAETERMANLLAEKVKVTYKHTNTYPPILTARDVLQSPTAKERTMNIQTIEPQESGTDIKHVIKGKFDIHGQYHYHMEPQSCICVPIEDGLDVYPSAQWMDYTQLAIGDMLNLPQNSININVRRLGGAYGAKISRSVQVATACALAATKLNRPIRFVLPIETNMLSIGKRIPCSSDYEIGVNDRGAIQYLRNTFYGDYGCSFNETFISSMGIQATINTYNTRTWYIQSNAVLTDTPSNSWCRAPVRKCSRPFTIFCVMASGLFCCMELTTLADVSMLLNHAVGYKTSARAVNYTWQNNPEVNIRNTQCSAEGHAMVENMMDHIATVTGIDPTEVRMRNMITAPLPELIDCFKKSTDFEARCLDVNNYNSTNRWRKRGISLTPMNFNLDYYGNFASFIAIYHGDGTVAVSHGGIEMGQGINTKVAQVCAYTLKIPLELVSVKPTNNLVSPNMFTSAASISSESCCFATVKACEILLDRLEPIRKTMDNPTWRQLIDRAQMSGVDLSAHYMTTQSADGYQNYKIYGVTITEVEVDIITGIHQILRVDILEDTGESLSPDIDVGQIEGSYIMGMGYWTSEKLVYDKKTGELLTTRTWNYKPPGMKDIPIDLRVEFRRNAPNPAGILRSKATGEPSFVMSYGIMSAIRQAIASARIDNGFPVNEWFPMDIPLTVENVVLAANTSLDEFKLQG